MNAQVWTRVCHQFQMSSDHRCETIYILKVHNRLQIEWFSSEGELWYSEAGHCDIAMLVELFGAAMALAGMQYCVIL